MKYFNSILDCIGKTPLVKLNKIGKDLTPDIYLKLEYLNPGGSSKDRIAIRMIEEAEKKGLLKPGGTIIEPTSGNTGIGIAMVSAVKGYKAIIVLSSKQSREKIDLLKSFGAEVIVTPAGVSKDSPDSIYNVAKKIALEIPGSYLPDQYSNMCNPDAHYSTTGPEIWEDMDGRIDYIFIGMGTGGTITGTAKYLKEKDNDIVVIGVDPVGSLFSQKEALSCEIEGIGTDFIPAVTDMQIIDEFIIVSDEDAFRTTIDLARKEGILAGGSAGACLFAALEKAKKIKEKKNFVVLIPDTGRNYLSKFYSRYFK